MTTSPFAPQSIQQLEIARQAALAQALANKTELNQFSPLAQQVLRLICLEELHQSAGFNQPEHNPDFRLLLGSPVAKDFLELRAELVPRAPQRYPIHPVLRRSVLLSVVNEPNFHWLSLTKRNSPTQTYAVAYMGALLCGATPRDLPAAPYFVGHWQLSYSKLTFGLDDAAWEYITQKLHVETRILLVQDFLVRAMQASVPTAGFGWNLTKKTLLSPDFAIEGSPAWSMLNYAAMSDDQALLGRLPEAYRVQAELLKSSFEGDLENAKRRLQLISESLLRPKGAVNLGKPDFAQGARSAAKSVLPPLWNGTLILLALAAECSHDSLKMLRRYKPIIPHTLTVVAKACESFVDHRLNGKVFVTAHEISDSMQMWCICILRYWLDLPLAPNVLEWLQRESQSYRLQGWRALADQLAFLAGEPVQLGQAPIFWRTRELSWERQLRALERCALASTDADAALLPAVRLVVMIDARSYAEQSPGFTLIAQKLSAKGEYSKGAEITSLSRGQALLEELALDDEQARKILSVYLRELISYRRDYDDLLRAMVGYPHVMMRQGKQNLSIEVCEEQAQLHFEEHANGVKIRIRPEPIAARDYRLALSPKKLLIYRYPPELRTIAKAFEGQSSADFPRQALSRVLKLSADLAPRVSTQSNLTHHARMIDSVDHRIHVQIEAMNQGLRFKLRAYPLGSSGTFMIPGEGGAKMLGVMDGETITGTRELALETQELEALYQEVPNLLQEDNASVAEITEPDQAMTTLEALQSRSERNPLHWSTQVQKVTRSRSISIQVRSQQNWFEATGSIDLEDGEVISLSTLLEALPSSQSRYVRLSGDRVLALNQSLMRQLQQLKAMGGDRAKFAKPGVVSLQALFDENVQLKLDPTAQSFLTNLRHAQMQTPEIPGALQADLRDYQSDGVRWMLRLAQWAPGALLADDMGLGKTLQALAVLIARGEKGPQIVFAPTSVVGNWQREARRFAPTLEVRVFAEGDRQQTLDQLSANQVLLVSYGLLGLHSEALSKPVFATAVFDEAQALKNAKAQRTEAAALIQREFALVLSGTPIENNLGELWSVMSQAVPGLLGGPSQFKTRFVSAIENNPKAPQKQALRQLISPFLLRRTKSQVLEELPPRTEIIVSIEPSKEEALFLSAIRKQAIERIQTQELASADKRFNVLAELMRLRRAACHPMLVAPELNLSSSKLTQLMELLQELRSNRHRALVFSQFVDYLSIVRKACEEQKITYQYLDGSTSPRARQVAIDEFQAGRGDAFLLSLKAGGVGLNLTAADYVIHLDPWWNPAVEQQATDRAHRIGQTRPVTVYKLVVKDSIEEQIQALHGNKRELVDSILADQSDNHRLSIDELTALLTGNVG